MEGLQSLGTIWDWIGAAHCWSPSYLDGYHKLGQRDSTTEGAHYISKGRVVVVLLPTRWNITRSVGRHILSFALPVLELRYCPDFTLETNLLASLPKNFENASITASPLRGTWTYCKIICVLHGGGFLPRLARVLLLPQLVQFLGVSFIGTKSSTRWYHREQTSSLRHYSRGAATLFLDVSHGYILPGGSFRTRFFHYGDRLHVGGIRVIPPCITKQNAVLPWRDSSNSRAAPVLARSTFFAVVTRIAWWQSCRIIASCIVGYLLLFCATAIYLVHYAYPSILLCMSLDCSMDGVFPRQELSIIDGQFCW